MITPLTRRSSTARVVSRPRRSRATHNKCARREPAFWPRTPEACLIDDLAGRLHGPTAWSYTETMRRQDPSMRRRLNPRIDLKVIFGLNDLRDIPTTGSNLIVVAVVEHKIASRIVNKLHLRVFDVNGSMIVNTNESRLIDQGQRVEHLKGGIANSWDSSRPTAHNASVIAEVKSLINRILAEEDSEMTAYAVTDAIEALMLFGTPSKRSRRRRLLNREF